MDIRSVSACEYLTPVGQVFRCNWAPSDTQISSGLQRLLGFLYLNGRVILISVSGKHVIRVRKIVVAAIMLPCQELYVSSSFRKT